MSFVAIGYKLIGQNFYIWSLNCFRRLNILYLTWDLIGKNLTFKLHLLPGVLTYSLEIYSMASFAYACKLVRHNLVYVFPYGR
jgi:hypothetical protein